MNALDTALLAEIRRKKKEEKPQIPKIKIYNPKKYVSDEIPVIGDYDPSYSVVRKRSP